MDRGFRFRPVDAVVIIATVALVGAFLIPAGGAIRAARREARETTCADNQRRIAMAGMMYAMDYRDALPTRIGDTRLANGHLINVPRLPIVGFDTLTAVEMADYQPYAGLGGWAYLVRDYLKNQTRLLACPEGWYEHDDIFRPSDTVGWDRTAQSPDRAGLTADGCIGYFWLPHRPPSSGACMTKLRSGGLTCRDRQDDIATSLTDRPELALTADMIYGFGRGFGGLAVIGSPPVVLYFNHAPPDVVRGALRAYSDDPLAQSVPHYDFDDKAANDPDRMPRGSNACRLDGAIRWTPFPDLPVVRSALVDVAFYVW